MKQFRFFLLLFLTLSFSTTIIAATPYCKAQQLAIYYIAGQVQGMDGTSESVYAIINNSQTPCLLRGVPDVGIVFENEKQVQFVKCLCSKNSFFRNDVPKEKNAKNIIVEPYKENATPDHLTYFTIHLPGGGYADDNDVSVDAYIRSIKLPGISQPLPIPQNKNDSPQRLFVVSSPVQKNLNDWLLDVKKNGSYGNECDLNDKDNTEINFDNLQTLTLKKIIDNKIICGG